MKRFFCMFAFIFSVLSMKAGDTTKIVNIFKDEKVSKIAENMDAEIDIVSNIAEGISRSSTKNKIY